MTLTERLMKVASWHDDEAAEVLRGVWRVALHHECRDAVNAAILRLNAQEVAIRQWQRAHDGFRSGRAPVHLLHAAEAALLDVARGEA